MWDWGKDTQPKTIWLYKELRRMCNEFNRIEKMKVTELVTKESLLERKFVDLSDPLNSGFILKGKNADNYITAESDNGEPLLISVCRVRNDCERFDYVHVPNCKTIEQLDQLIAMFL